MGFLTEGNLLAWKECAKYAEEILTKGINQFITHYIKHKTRRADKFLWGDEVEQYLIKFDHNSKKVYLSLQAQDILHVLKEKQWSHGHSRNDLFAWTPEFAEYQLESSPGVPYEGLFNDVASAEINMADRRKELDAVLADDEVGLRLAVFPRMGIEGYTWPSYQADPNRSSFHSVMFPEEAMCRATTRYLMLARNTCARRGAKCETHVPIYRDINTLGYVMETMHTPKMDEIRGSVTDQVYIDYFAADCNSVQVNVQSSSLEEARVLYDQLAVLAPIMLALSASSPIHHGYLCDEDTRWRMQQETVDFRTAAERGLVTTSGKDKEPKRHAPFGTIEGYLSLDGALYHDVDVVMDGKLYQQMMDGGVDQLMARHIAHVCQTPVLIGREFLEDGHTASSDINVFQMLYSTSWQTVKLKLPQGKPEDGWKVEFRTMEVQITDFENAALCVFVVLLTRIILHYDLDLRIPISKLDENLQMACKRDAAKMARFYFRTQAVAGQIGVKTNDWYKVNKGLINNKNSDNLGAKISKDRAYSLLTINEIFHGKGGNGGLLTLIHQYLDEQDLTPESRCLLDDYLSFISKRASGELLTPASWIRQYVMSHPEYKRDSVVSETITYDLIQRLVQLSRGEIDEPSLVPNRRSTITKTGR